MALRNQYINPPPTVYGSVQSSAPLLDIAQPQYGHPPSGRPYAQESPIFVQGPAYTTGNTTTIPPDFTPAQVAPGLSQNLPAESWVGSPSIRTQIKSAGSGSLILITGGMNIAWSCGFAAIIGYQANTHIIICWYIAAIIGAMIGAITSSRMPTKPIYMFSAFLVLIGGILFVSLPHKYGAAAAARYLNGFGVGLVIVPTLVLVGEEVNSGARGLAASIIEMSNITLGIFLQIIFVSAFELTSGTINFYEHEFGSTHLNGIFTIILSLITIVFSYFFVIESPTYYLLRNAESQALDCLLRLQHPSSVTQQTHQQLEEHKRYIDSNSPAGDLGILALLKLCLYRALIALSFSPFTTAGLQLSTILYFGQTIVWPYIVYGLMLWFGSFLASFLMDSLGRKKLMLSGVLLSGGLAIGIGSIYDNLENILFNYHMDTVLYMLIVLQLFAGIFRSASSAYLTEAFPLHFKPNYIAIAFSVEMLVMLIMGACIVDVDRFGSYFITFGVLYLIFFCASIVLLPETKKLTLREAQEKFKNVLNISL